MLFAHGSTGAKARARDEQSFSALLTPDMLGIFETPHRPGTFNFCMTDPR